MSSLSATPAYGRDYKSRKALMADWAGGKDFLGFSMIQRFSGYFSIRDTAELRKRFSHVEFRYDKGRKVFLLKV